MKTCSNKDCLQSNPQSLEQFYKQKDHSDGLTSKCRACTIKYNSDRRKPTTQGERSASAKWRDKNLVKKVKIYTSVAEAKAIKKAWREANKDKIRASKLRHHRKYPHKANADASKRRATKVNATPKWLTKEQLKSIELYYEVAKWIESILNEPIDVDHVVPLRGKAVNGLHVPWNLQLLTAEDNNTKNNKF